MANLAEATMEEITVKAIVTRANGAVEDHGTVCHWRRDDDTPPPRGVVQMLKNFFSNTKDDQSW